MENVLLPPLLCFPYVFLDFGKKYFNSNMNGPAQYALAVALQDALQREQLAQAQAWVRSRGMGTSWEVALQAEFLKTYFLQLMEFEEAERRDYTVYPPTEQVFAWTRYCHIRDVKVVIVGQEPYSNEGQANGLCFSSQSGVNVPRSLQNIYKELRNDFGESFTIPNHGDLSGWAAQGVLLLNNVLTVRGGERSSHKGKRWEIFTDSVIQWIHDNFFGVVFILWGNDAQRKGRFIDGSKHLVLTGAHPSPLAANRGGFFGQRYFSQANAYLIKYMQQPIDWSRFTHVEPLPF